MSHTCSATCTLPGKEKKLYSKKVSFQNVKSTTQQTKQKRHHQKVYLEVQFFSRRNPTQLFACTASQIVPGNIWYKAKSVNAKELTLKNFVHSEVTTFLVFVGLTTLDMWLFEHVKRPGGCLDVSLFL